MRLRQDIPLIGSTLTLALIEAKLKEHRIKPYTLNVAEGQKEKIGPFDLEFIAVNHSIPDALAVAITTVAGTVLHTGDFKMDQLPLDDRITDLRAFARLGEAGVDLFLVDSTNADVPGFTPNERDIGPVLEAVIAKAPRRVIVASFSSHVHRVQQVLDAAVANNRKVALMGRSMVRNMGIAADLGYLKVPDGVLIDAKKAVDFPDNQLVYMSTGQPGRADGRARAHGQPGAPDRGRPGRHRHPRLQPHPGQRERGVPRHQRPHQARRQRRAQGATPRCTSRATLRQGSCSTATTSFSPKNVLPVHGEYRHLVANAKLAIQTGVPAENTIIAEDGTVIDLKDGDAAVVGQLDLGFVYVDGSTVGEITDADLKDRRILAEEGFISIFVAVDAADRQGHRRARDPVARFRRRRERSSTP